MFIRSGRQKISDISELNKKGKAEMIAVESVPASEKKAGRLREYFAERKYYIMALASAYILGTAIGGMLINNLGRAEAAELCAIVDSYFLYLPSAGMMGGIPGNIAVNLAFMLGAYLFGATIFAPVVCAALSLYKGLSAGFIIGVYMIGGGTGFHAAAGISSFALNIFVMIFFIMACAESMSFASFLFKSDESFKSSMSFKNISVYSSRFIILGALAALATVVQTAVMPLIYAWFA